MSQVPGTGAARLDLLYLALGCPVGRDIDVDRAFLGVECETKAEHRSLDARSLFWCGP
jgi:hypothetical protein